MRICFITFRYPGKYNKTDFVFVKNLVDAIAALGNDCHVIAPFSITHYHRFPTPKEKYTQGKGTITVYRPGYLSFSKFHIGKYKFSDWTHKRAIHKAFRMLIEKPDIIYGHFWNSAYDGYDYARQNNIPLFVATGESKLSEMFHPKANQTEFSNHVSGVICVSSKNKNELLKVANTIHAYLKDRVINEKFGVLLYSPVPSPIDKIKDRYRMRIIIKCKYDEKINDLMNGALDTFYNMKVLTARLAIELNPNNMQ